MRADNAGAKQFIADKGLSYTMLEGNKELAINDYKISYTPSSFLIGRDGSVVSFHGVISDIGALEQEIADLLK